MKQRRLPVVSEAGVRATRTVGILRFASAVFTAATIVAAGNILVDPKSSARWYALAFIVAAGVFAFAEKSVGGRTARSEERRIRARLLDRFYSATVRSDAQGDEFPPRSVIQMMTDNTERVTEYRQVYLGSTLAALMIPIAVVIYVGLFMDAVVGFGVLAAIPAIPLLIGGFMRLFRKTSANSRKQRAELSGRYLDAIRNLVVIRLYGAGGRIEQELAELGEKNRGAIMRLLAGNQVVIIIMDGVFSLVLICLTAGLVAMRAEYLSGAEVFSIMLLTALLLEPLQQVAGFFYIGMGGIASQRALRSYLEATATSAATDITNRQVLNEEGRSSVSLDVPSLDSPAPSHENPALAVELVDVHFDHGRGPVLQGVDLSVPIGARVAITGRSGAGKSTLLALVRGGLAPQRGRVAVGTHQVDPDDLSATRRQSATVAQRTWMFTGSIADNLRIADGGASDDDLWDVLEQAQIASEIRRMPQKLDTQIGEDAALISGGQAQRISLARALLSKRSLLVLDEPTSQVDAESEAQLIEAIAALPRSLTVLFVTHRESLLSLADEVYELTEGRLTQVQNHNGDHYNSYDTDPLHKAQFVNG